MRTTRTAFPYLNSRNYFQEGIYTKLVVDLNIKHAFSAIKLCC